jgi:hypothetical protein
MVALASVPGRHALVFSRPWERHKAGLRWRSAAAGKPQTCKLSWYTCS